MHNSLFAGQPKRHLLTTGWSVFVSTKRLFAGDSVIFIRYDSTCIYIYLYVFSDRISTRSLSIFFFCLTEILCLNVEMRSHSFSWVQGALIDSSQLSLHQWFLVIACILGSLLLQLMLQQITAHLLYSTIQGIAITYFGCPWIHCYYLIINFHFQKIRY